MSRGLWKDTHSSSCATRGGCSATAFPDRTTRSSAHAVHEYLYELAGWGFVCATGNENRMCGRKGSS